MPAASLTDGTSGSSGLRPAEVIASARALPAFTGSGTVGRLAKKSGTCPPIRSTIAGLPPL